jgi:small-conductance mechanosensitive channel
MKKNLYTFWRLGGFWLLVILLLFRATGAPAAPSASAGGGTGLKPHDDFNQSVLETIALERENIGRRKEQLATLQGGQDAFKSDINALRLQLSANGNLLLSPSLDLEVFEKAASGNRSALDRVESQAKEASQQLEKIQQASLKNEEQYRLNKEQLTQLSAEKRPSSAVRSLVKNLTTLLKLLDEKRKLFASLGELCTARKKGLDELRAPFQRLQDQLDAQIIDIKKQQLFQRRDTALRITQWRQLLTEVEQVRIRVAQILTTEFWRKEFFDVWQIEGLLLLSLALLAIIILSVFYRVRRITRALATRPFYREHPWRLLSFQVLTDSLPLLGILILLGVLTHVRKVGGLSVLIPLQSILWVFLVSRWWLDTLAALSERAPEKAAAAHAGHLTFLVRFSRWFAVFYILADWMITGTSLILFLFRAFFETGLLIWAFSLKRRRKRAFETGEPAHPVRSRRLGQVLVGTGYLLICTAPLLELAGFGQFALYWYLSWGRTLTSLLWAGLVLGMLREWDQPFVVSEPGERPGSSPQAQPVRWILFRVCWLVWAGLLFLALLFSWGARQPILAAILEVLRYPFRVGQMQLSLMGFIASFLLLFFTHLLVRIVRYLLREKLLSTSGIERGLQESITHIAAYVIWSFGILAALHAMGFNTASLAVILGAMGIGLGFGLQNIFNNFISGIILLFERPIQAGDDVEINGVWATVKKINVRSTIVQTYDNASLIIPNSEFISNQVTNWSFKDRRLRRRIGVGVAYGSDTALVRKTLLEIAGNTRQVLKYPAPDVIFSDFGDSALLFTLRIWSTVDIFLAVESEIRYEIDRLFKERNINIAFPQRDIHVYSGNDDGVIPPVGAHLTPKPTPDATDDPGNTSEGTV